LIDNTSIGSIFDIKKFICNFYYFYFKYKNSIFARNKIKNIIMTVIYEIKCPKTGFLLYVGRSISFEGRKKEHMQGCFGYIGKYIKALTSIGEDPIFGQLETCEDEDANEREGLWIEKLSPLLNIATSGNVSVKRRHNKIRKTKYPFNSIKVGDTFEINSEDFNSMSTSLRGFNSRHSTKIQLSASDSFTDGNLIIQRIK